MNKKLIAVAAAIAGVLTYAGVAFAAPASNTPAGWPSGKPMFCVNRGTNTVVFNYARNSFCAQGTYPLDSSGYVPNIVVPVVTPTPTPTPTVNDTVAVTRPENQVGVFGAPVTNVKVQATDTTHERLSFTMTGAPHGLVIDRRSGVISGTATSTVKASETYSVTVTATDTSGVSASATFKWTFNQPV